jgi:hypothetical protein
VISNQFSYILFAESRCSYHLVLVFLGIRKARRSHLIKKTLKGHGNEADFLGFLQKLGPHSRHGESGSRYSNFLKFSIDFPDLKRLDQPFKRSI